HPVDLTREQPLAGGLGEKGEGLGEHERKRSAEQPIEHAADTWGRVLLDAENCPHARARRQAVLHDLPAEAQPRGRKGGAERTARQRYPLPFSIDEQSEIFEER